MSRLTACQRLSRM